MDIRRSTDGSANVNIQHVAIISYNIVMEPNVWKGDPVGSSKMLRQICRQILPSCSFEFVFECQKIHWRSFFPPSQQPYSLRIKSYICENKTKIFPKIKVVNLQEKTQIFSDIKVVNWGEKNQIFSDIKVENLGEKNQIFPEIKVVKLGKRTQVFSEIKK